MAAPRSPRRALAGIVVALVLALALGALVAAGAGAAPAPRAAAWKLPPSLSHCAAGCSIGHRLLIARLSREAAASASESTSSARPKARARPAADTASGIEGNVTAAATKEGLTGIEVCAYEV